MKDVKSKRKFKPFLKWAGGKTQMLSELEKFVPVDFDKYIEPFIGAGALFFHLNEEKSVIADSNFELILTYKVIQEKPLLLIEKLKDFQNTEEFFYSVRAWDTEKLDDVTCAARLIFLNKTCFNGLYRVNKNGKFNTPYGKRKNPLICDSETLMNASEALKTTKIIHQDFEQILTEYACKGDFVFLDPPYVPVSEYADFKRYTKDFFSEGDQIRLKNQFDRLVEIGAYPILTNSDAPFVLDLYKDYRIEIVSTRRSISSNAKTRKGTDVIIIGN